MSDYNFQNMLKSGFFNTSRARNNHSPFAESQSRPFSSSVSSMSDYVPRWHRERPHRRRSYPPPPSVEDEVVSLAREHRSTITPVFEEEPQSRGEIDQQPIMIEVHEHNPERRFVIVPSSSKPPKTSDGGAEDSVPGIKTRQRARSTEQPPSELPSSDAEQGRNDDLEPTNHPYVEAVEDDAVPSPGRRGSRQDLPRLETDLNEDWTHRTPAHHRSKSAASAIRPDIPLPRQSRPYVGDYLSPEITKHGPGGRDKTYYGYGRTPTNGGRSPTKGNFSDMDNRRGDGVYPRRSVTPSMDGRSSSNFETRNSRRPMSMSNDRINDPRYWDGNRSPRSDFGAEPYRPGTGHGEGKTASPLHQQSCSCDVSFGNSRRRGNSMVIEDDRDRVGLARRDSDSSRNARSPSRTQTMPIPPTSLAELPDEMFVNPRSSATFPINLERKSQESRKSPLPYPDDDDPHDPWNIGLEGSDHAGPLQEEIALIASMPHIPPVIDGLEINNDTGIRVMSLTPPVPPLPQSWQPPSFDPIRDGVRIGNVVGSYRHYSESKGRDGQQFPEIPECAHTEPVVGKMDWLTLPMTDFNICPDCYDGVFADTEYRTLFKPMLRPTLNPIACDFGSSPWYRIAWLLTMKHRVGDLHLFYHIANIMSASHNQPCPGSRKDVRNWFTVMDPYTRRPVPEFTVCYHCAKMVETLLPNLTGVFVPLTPRQELTRNVCALHFTPERKQFILFFDAFETTSDKAFMVNRKPDIGDLSITLSRLSTLNECREDRRVTDGYWYTMEFLPDFTVCGECYEDMVRPKRAEDNVIAQDFFPKPQKIPVATCQLYSPRMRDVFRRACRNNDPEYLEEKVRERLKIEKDIHTKFINLVRDGRSDAWTEDQIDRLSREWKKWE